MNDAPPKPIRFGDLGIRIASGLVLAAIAFLNVWMGGLWALALVLVLLLAMLWEYYGMVTGDRRAGAPALLALLLGGAAAVIATDLRDLATGLILLGFGGLAAGLLARPRFGWLLAGSLYLGGAMCMLVVLGQPVTEGFQAVLWLVIVVVGADVGAYFAGRTIGGPKLWPAVSPGKTWAGVWGGLALAVLVGVAFSSLSGWPPLRMALLSLLVAAASVAGDLLESAVKRHFQVKDTSALIPGHGGVMDRLDGLIGAAWLLLFGGLFGLQVGTG